MKQNIKDRVWIILKNAPDTRNSDIMLIIKYFNHFHWTDITLRQVNKMLDSKVSFSSIIRERSRYQNRLKQYEASPEIKKKRKQNQEQYRNRYAPLYNEDL